MNTHNQKEKMKEQISNQFEGRANTNLKLLLNTLGVVQFIQQTLYLQGHRLAQLSFKATSRSL